MADSGTWNTNASGPWSTSGNWLNGTVADGEGFTANFVFNITATRTVTLDSDRTIGGLTFTDATTSSNDWALSGANTLTLNGTSPVTINVTNRTATINLIMTTADGDQVQKSGGGTLVLNAQNTIAGGFRQGVGVTRINVSSTVGSGAITSGPVGTGTLVLASGTFQDNGSARTLHNAVDLAGNVTLSSSGSGSLTFNGTGLTTPTNITISAASPTLTVTNTTNFTSVIDSANPFTKNGSGRLNINADNSSTWSAPSVTATGGVLAFASLNSLPTGAARPVVAGSGGSVTLGSVALTQAFVDKVATDSAGVIALGAATSDDINFTGFTAGVRLGSTGTFTYTGAHTPANPNEYRLGGGGGILTYATAISGAGVSVNVGRNGSANGAVVLSNAANSFGGGITIDNGILSIDTADGAAGDAASKLGAVPSTPTNSLTLLNGGLVSYANAGASLNVNRSVVTGTGGGGVDTNGNNFTFSNAISGTGPFIKDGAGTLTMTTVPGAGVGLIVRGGGTTVGSASVLNANGQSFSLPSLFVSNDTFASGAQTAELTNVANLTVNGPVTIGADSPGKLTINAGGQLNVDSSGSNFIIMDRPSSTLFTGTFTSTVDASAASSVDLNVSNLIINDGNSGAGGGTPVGVLILPTGAASTVEITTASAFRVGVLNNNGGSASLTFGGGENVVRTNTFSVGAGKITGTATITPGGHLDLQGLTGGKAALSIGDNNANTGISTNSKLDLTGGSIGSAATPARFSTVLIAAATTGNTGSSTGQFIIDGATSVVEADSIAIAQGRSGNTSATTGTLRILEGTLRLTGGDIAHGAAGGSGTRTSAVELLGGLLDLAGGDITSITDLTFTGGSLRNVGTLTRAAGLTQNGPTTAFQILANNTTLTGPYTITAGTTAIDTTRLLAVGGVMDLSGAADTLLISDTTNQLTGPTITLATYASLAGGAHYDTVKYFDGVSTLTFTDAQATSAGSLPNGYVVEYGATSLQLVQVPEPAAMGLLAIGAVGLLGRRRRMSHVL